MKQQMNRIHGEADLRECRDPNQFTSKISHGQIQELTDSGKAKRIDTIKTFAEVCDLISCTTFMAVSCLYCMFLCIPYKKSFELRG